MTKRPLALGDLVSLDTIKEAHIAAVVLASETYEAAAAVLEIEPSTLWRWRIKCPSLAKAIGTSKNRT